MYRATFRCYTMNLHIDRPQHKYGCSETRDLAWCFQADEGGGTRLKNRPKVGIDPLRVTDFLSRGSAFPSHADTAHHGRTVLSDERQRSFRACQDRERMRYEIFIDAPYHDLVDSSVRFYNTSGISVSASAEGLQINTGSVDTVL